MPDRSHACFRHIERLRCRRLQNACVRSAQKDYLLMDDYYREPERPRYDPEKRRHAERQEKRHVIFTTTIRRRLAFITGSAAGGSARARNASKPQNTTTYTHTPRKPSLSFSAACARAQKVDDCFQRMRDIAKAAARQVAAGSAAAGRWRQAAAGRQVFLPQQTCVRSAI